jgi:hypothetical protein
LLRHKGLVETTALPRSALAPRASEPLGADAQMVAGQ